MHQATELTTLTGLLDQLEATAKDQGEISIGDIMKTLGDRSFGPLLLIAGLITLAPIVGDIPGVPTVVGVFVFLISVQLLFHRKHLWLPQWLLRRSVSHNKVIKAIGWMRKPAKVTDRILRPRLQIFAEGTAFYVIVAIALLIAAVMPLMEVVPFSANAAGAALTAMGLGLISRDGVLVFLAILIVFATVGLSLWYFL